MSSGRAFRIFVEEELGRFPHFLIYAVLEWTLISLLFLDGFLAFVSSVFADYFDLRAPCVLCARIDHILTRNKSRFCYNEVICEGHKKDLSSLAYCHVHRNLSDIRRMCEGCLLSFATDNKSDSETYKSYNGSRNKDLGLFDEEVRARLNLQPYGKVEPMAAEEKAANYANVVFCSCCGEPMKAKSSGFQKSSGNVSNPAFSRVPSRLSLTGPTSSPRAHFASWRSDEARATLELSQIRCAELKMGEPAVPDEEEAAGNHVVSESKEDVRALVTPRTATEQSDHPNFEDFVRTPSSARGNRFFGISDSAASSPRWANRMPRKSLLDRVELASDPAEAIAGSETSTEAILNRLKNQVRMDKKSLIALYMELDEERAASAVAANNAMAMITRLQAEKAAVQMEALQYQRMMEEQAEYDQEAIQMLKDFLSKREEEIKELEDELYLYRDRFGEPEVSRGDQFEKSQSFSSLTEHGEESPLFSIVATDTEMDVQDHISDKSRLSNEAAARDAARKTEEDTGDNPNEDDDDDVGGSLSIDIERERSYLFGQLRILESRLLHSPIDNDIHLPNEEQAGENEKMIQKEVSEMGEKLRALEEDSRFLKRALKTLQKDNAEGSKLLTEIAENLQKLRHKDS